MPRYEALPIYGDPNLGYWDPGGPQEVEIDDNYKMKWPDGYWQDYERLRERAFKVSNALSLHMVMCLNGRYRVYALMPAGVGSAGPTYGPEHHDRLGAWEQFIAGFEITVSGTVKLGAPNANKDVIVDGDEMRKNLTSIAGRLNNKRGRKT